jgi:hypothetical protein
MVAAIEWKLNLGDLVVLEIQQPKQAANLVLNDKGTRGQRIRSIPLKRCVHLIGFNRCPRSYDQEQHQLREERKAVPRNLLKSPLR